MTNTAPQRDPVKVIPPEVLRRWQDMVRRAVAANQPVGPMVQQFAEQAFNRRVAHLKTQATRKRDLVALRRVIAQELEAAEEHLRAVESRKSEVLPKPYQGYVFELRARDEKQAKKAERLNNTPIARASEDHAHKATPIESMFSQRTQLVKYADTLRAQVAAIDHEQSTIEAAVSRGMENRESLVNELTEMAWALYKVAEGIIASMQPSRVEEFLPEDTMAAFKPKPPPPVAISSDDTTMTAAASAPSPPRDPRVTQALTQSSESADVAELHSAIATLVADAIRQFVTRAVGALPLAKVDAGIGAFATVLGKGLDHAGLIAGYTKGVALVVWRDVLRRIFKVLAKPHMP